MSLTEAELLHDIRQRLFSPKPSATPRAVGLELELIPVYAASRRPVPVVGDESSAGSADILSRLAHRDGWDTRENGEDPPSWVAVDGTRVSFEPGGQIEISGAPMPGASSAIAAMKAITARIVESMGECGIDLVARGVDPYNDIVAVPLQLHRDRYARMTRFLDSINPSGIRMMRQTAALQINLDRGDDPLSRWRLLNALVPIVIALFANSVRYAGADTGWQSYRSHLWRTLDTSRTGLAYSDKSEAQCYLEFALNALAMHSPETKYVTFREWMVRPEVSREDWAFHLSTLFPEVRPREYFELRSADTIEPDSLAAPVVFVTSLVYDPRAAAEAESILGPPDESALASAGRLGLQDAEIRGRAERLVGIALTGAERLGKDYVAVADVRAARDYFDRRLAI